MIIPCECGETPALVLEGSGRWWAARAKCPCGKILPFTEKCEGRAAAEESAIEDWNASRVDTMVRKGRKKTK